MNTAEWLRRKAEYTSSLGMSTVRMEMDAGNLAGVLRALAQIADRDVEPITARADVETVERVRRELEERVSDG